MRHMIKLRLAAAVVPICLFAVACGGDDGATVRQIDAGTEGSTSASGSASGAGAGAGSGSASASGTAAPAIDPATADTTVPVTLSEWTVVPEPAEVAAGVIAFEATNGGSVPHELYIARAENAEALPTSANGGADEAQLPAGAFIGEIEGFASGTTMTAAFQMEPGTYVLFCNIADDTGVHFAEGMHTTFTVT